MDGRYVGYLPPWTNQGAGGEDLTFRLTRADKDRLLAANTRMSEAMVNRVNGSANWTPGEKKLTFGKGGTVLTKGWFTSGVLAELIWEDHYAAHVLTRVRTGWAKVEINGQKLTGARSLRPGDTFLIGRSRFRYVLPSGSR